METYIALLRNNNNYRNLWLGAVISQLGDWFNLIASANLIAELTESGTAISGLFLARFLPLFLFSPLAGVLADRFDRRRIMILTNLLRTLTVLGFLLIRDPGQIWLLYLLTSTQFALSAIFIPARSAVIANIVEEEDLVTANALDSFTWSTMLAFGALLGGLVAGIFGNAAAFAIDAATFVFAAWFISRIQIPDSIVHARAAASQGGFLDFIDGLRYLRGEPYILMISLIKGAGSLIYGAINVLEVNFAEDVFPLGQSGALTLGLIYAVTGLGTGFGPLLLRRWLGDEPRRLLWAIAAGFWLVAFGILAIGAAPSLPWLGVGTFVRTVGSGTTWVFSAAMLQMIVPDRFRGRVFAFEFAVLTLTQSFSIFWAGFAQDNLGWTLRGVTTDVGIAGLAVAALWLLFHLFVVTRPTLPNSLIPLRQRRTTDQATHSARPMH